MELPDYNPINDEISFPGQNPVSHYQIIAGVMHFGLELCRNVDSTLKTI